MEQDRYQHSPSLFIISMICMVISLSLFAFSFFILPHLIWDLNYNIPGFIFTWTQWFKESYSYSDAGAKVIVFLLFFIPALIASLICYFTSNSIDNALSGVVPEKPLDSNEKKFEMKETFSIGFKIIILIVVVVIVVFAAQWLLSVPASTEGL